MLKNQMVSALEFSTELSAVLRKPLYLCMSDNFLDCNKDWHGDILVFEGNEQHKKIHAIYNLVKVKGKLFFHFYAKHTSKITFRSDDFTLSDNGRIWYCNGKEVKFLILISKLARVRILENEALTQFIKKNKVLCD